MNILTDILSLLGSLGDNEAKLVTTLSIIVLGSHFVMCGRCACLAAGGISGEVVLRPPMDLDGWFTTNSAVLTARF